MVIDTKLKSEIIKKFQSKEDDTGSSEVQIALLTERINQLSTHLKVHRKDFSSKLGLTKIIEYRKKLIRYFKGKNQERCLELMKELGIRK